MDIWIWGAVIVLALVIEAITSELVSVWFGAGGLIGLILAICSVPLEWQIVVALIISLILLLSMRKITLKWLNKPAEKTNTEAFLGKVTKLLTATTDQQTGTIKLNGVVWTAESEKPIKEGTNVKIIAISGNKLKVAEQKIEKDKGE